MCGNASNSAPSTPGRSKNDNEPGAQQHGALAATRYQNAHLADSAHGSAGAATVAGVEPLLVITDDRTGDLEGLAPAIDVLRTATSVEVSTTSHYGDLDGILHRAGSRPIVVGGDDRSLHAVIATLHRRNDLAGTVIGLLPWGSSHGFATARGIPLDPLAAARTLLAAVPVPCDVLVDELGQVSVNGVHAGADLPAATGSRAGRTLGAVLGGGRLRSALLAPVEATVETLRPAYARLRVEVDGAVVADMDSRVRSVCLGAEAIRTGAEARPTADGATSISVRLAHGPVPGWLSPATALRRQPRADLLELRGRQVTISGEDFWISSDGQSSGPERRRSWHVEPEAYTLLAPGAGEAV